MDTSAAVQRLQAHGLTVEQAEDILAVLRGEMHQEFSRLRSDLLQEFGRVHTALEALRRAQGA